MKSNQVSVLVVLLLCLVMGGFLYVVDRSSDEEAGWTSSELYGELGARSYEGSSFSDVTFSGGGNSDGVAVSMRNGSFSLRTRARHTSSPNSLVANGVSGKSVDFLGALSPNSPIANGVPEKSADFWGVLSPNSLIGYMTSSAEFHSFGGGSNMAMGSYTSSSNSLIASLPAIGSYSPSPIAYNPIASSPNASGVGFNNLPSLQGGAGGRPVVSAEQALMSASSSASGLFGGMMTSYGVASYEQTMYGSYGSNNSTRRNSNRHNAPGFVGGGDDYGATYESWLLWMEKLGYKFGTSTEDGYEFDNDATYKAFLAWYKAVYGKDYDESNTMVPPEFTYADWIKWFTSNGGTHTHGEYTFKFTPVGDILPLVLLALMYMIILFVKRNKTAQL